MTKVLELSYLRTEINNLYTLFLKVDKTILDIDLDISIDEFKRLIIKDGASMADLYTTRTLPEDIFTILSTQPTLTIFTDEDGEFLVDAVLDLSKSIKKDKKSKP